MLNVIDLVKGTKADPIGIKADSITYASPNWPSCGLFRIAVGNVKGFKDTDWANSMEDPKQSKERGVKCNLYSFEQGILSPSIWFDRIDRFESSFNGIAYDICTRTVVHLNGKINIITQNGRLMSDTWYDIGHVNCENEAIVGILKSEKSTNLQDYTEDYSYNTEKYTLYKIDLYGKIRQLT